MKIFLNLLKNTPKLKAWFSIGITVLGMIEEAVTKINEDENLPNIK